MKSSIWRKRITPLRETLDVLATRRTARTMFLTAVAYYLGAQFGFSLRFPGSPLSVIWPPNAIVLAALLLVPTRTWWLLLLAVLPAHMLVEYQNGLEPLTIVGLYLTNCGQAVLGAAGVRWLSGGPPRLDTLNQMVAYGASAVLGAPFILSFLDTAVSMLTHWGGSQQYMLYWEERFVSNALTALALPPIILVVATRWHEWHAQILHRRYVEAALLGIGVATSGFLLLGTNLIADTGQQALVYLPIPFLLWAAVRFGVGGTGAALLGITVLSTGLNLGTVHGPFLADTPPSSVLALQFFLVALSAPALLLAALMEERDRTAAELRASEERYRSLVETQNDLICRYLPDGTLTFVNEAYCRYFARPREQLLGMRFPDLLPPAAARRSEAALGRFVRNPSAISDEHIVVLPDGTRAWQHWDEQPIFDRDRRLIEIQAIGRDITARKRAEQEVARLATRLLRVRDEEQGRIARELHDGTAQTLAGVQLILARLQLEIARKRQDKAKVGQLLAEGRMLATDAMREIRTISYLLHPPELEHLGLVGAVRAFAEGFTRRSGIEVTVAAPDCFDRLSPEAEIALFRVVQECLANIHHHSGSSRAHIRISVGHGCALLQVRDFGQGINANALHATDEEDPEPLGVGIPGMRQRLVEFGGRLKVFTGTQGTAVTAILPMRELSSKQLVAYALADDRQSGISQA